MKISIGEKSMCEFMKFVKSIPVATHLIGALPLAAWIIKAVWLDSINEPIVGMSALGRVVEGILSSVIAGYIFYILFALWPDFQSRCILAKFISGKARTIVGDCMAIIDEVNYVTKKDLNLFTASPEDISAAFSSISLNNHPRLMQQIDTMATWMQFFIYRQNRSKASIADLFNQNRYLDAELISTLVEISDCSFFLQISGLPNVPIKNPDLSAWEPGFNKYLILCRRLARWHDSNISTKVSQKIST